MVIRIRPFAESDYACLAALRGRLYPDWPATVESLRYDDSIWEADRFDRLRLTVEDAAGRPVAFGQIHHTIYEFHPQRYGLWIWVDPDHQRRGIGGRLYARLLEELHARNATSARATVRESHPEAVAFAERRGFVEVQREAVSELDVTGFDPAPFAEAIPRVEAQGIEIVTLPRARADDPDALPKIHALFSACDADVPSVTPVTPAGFEHWLAEEVESPRALPDAFFLARDGGEYVGVSNLQRASGDPTVLAQHLTGVLREYRGRGIAMALKVAGIAYARAHGFRLIRTGNDVTNRPMLRINEALGFVRQPAWIEMEKALA